MKAMAAKRARVARVRHAQHLLAAAEAARAEQQLALLKANSDKLATLRDSLTLDSGGTTGAVLRNRGELAARLDKVRDGLRDAIVGADATARARSDQRLDARQKQESAEKLGNRAAQSLSAWLEARRAVPFRRKTRSYDAENG
jgi:hypothetical protein